MLYKEQDTYRGRTLIQRHPKCYIIQNGLAPKAVQHSINCERAKALVKHRDFKRIIQDVCGPTGNMCG